MQNKKIRTVIIAAIVLLMLGVGLFGLEIEPAGVADAGNITQQDQQADVGGGEAEPAQGNIDIVQDNVDEPAVGDDAGDVSAADAPQTGGDSRQQADKPANDDSAKSPEQTQPAADPDKPDKPADPSAVTAPADNGAEDGADDVLTCTIEIRCDTVVDTTKLENQAAAPYVPADGAILAATEVEFTEGDSVFDILKQVTREKDIQMEFTEDTVYGSAYIEGINYLYEFDAGALSGWMYKVNDKFPNYGCSNYELQDGDAIVWMYTCDMGTDVGDNSDWH